MKKQITAIKNRWHAFSQREQHILIISIPVLASLFIYFFLWSPLSTSLNENKKEFYQQKNRLLYLTQASQKIQDIQNNGIQIISDHNQPLLTAVEKTLMQQHLFSYLAQVQQSHSHTATLLFDQVPYQKFIEWFQMLLTTKGIAVVQFQAQRLLVSGTANVTVTLIK